LIFAVWGILAFVALIKLNVTGVVVCVIAIALGVTNVLGYFKCRGDRNKQMRGTIQSFVVRQAVKQTVKQATNEAYV
jgi:hypothetical protein